MRRFTMYFIALGVLLIAAPTLAQAPALPLIPGYPINQSRAQSIFPPTIWTDGFDSWTAFHTHCGPGSLHVFQESAGFDVVHVPEPGCVPPHGWYMPDVFGNYIAVQEEFRTYNPYNWDSRIVTRDLTTGLLNDLSGTTAEYNLRPSIGDHYVAWERQLVPGVSQQVAFNFIGGNPATAKPVIVPKTSSERWPNVWGDEITMEITDPGGDGIAVFDAASVTAQVLTGPIPTTVGKAYRYAPHIADGRVAYHVRDVPMSPAAFSTIRYMDTHAWGTEVTPGFLRNLKCRQTSAPRVGGKGGRLILFTGTECAPDKRNYLFLGDTLTNKVYLVDEVLREPDTYDERPFYDILDDMIVYQYFRGRMEFRIVKIDMAAL